MLFKQLRVTISRWFPAVFFPPAVEIRGSVRTAPPIWAPANRCTVVVVIEELSKEDTQKGRPLLNYGFNHHLKNSGNSTSSMGHGFNSKLLAIRSGIRVWWPWLICDHVRETCLAKATKNGVWTTNKYGELIIGKWFSLGKAVEKPGVFTKGHMFSPGKLPPYHPTG